MSSGCAPMASDARVAPTVPADSLHWVHGSRAWSKNEQGHHQGRSPHSWASLGRKRGPDGKFSVARKTNCRPDEGKSGICRGLRCSLSGAVINLRPCPRFHNHAGGKVRADWYNFHRPEPDRGNWRRGSFRWQLIPFSWF